MGAFISGRFLKCDSLGGTISRGFFPTYTAFSFRLILRHLCSAGEVHYRQDRATGIAWDRIGWGVHERQRETRCRRERERMRLMDRTPVMWKEVPHNRVSNRAVCRKGQHRRHTPATHWGTYTWGDAPPTPPNPSPKDTLHTGVPNTAPTTTKIGLPHATGPC